ncbi:hypothetical protein C7T94_18610 [Pedobacter yulinensis]|uniref:PBCV-specific basic adaptor domain-containing protein n=1 Tax=Pedobacter yulinensis TaxID=2126353 RepID=A0A2T3HGR0_9SPHI|nr:hypothetical protein [Pedobacter yulinensis]PST81630.1 hypothetical protein C7T94_18610 [Pedobacter yulinensis]
MKRKYIVGLLTLAFGVLATVTVQAQTKVEKAAEKTGKAVEKGAKAVGNKTAEVAVKGSAKVADKTWKGKMAPDGSNVYIDADNKKYYVNKKGARIYLKPSQIRTRPAGE